MSMFEDNIKDCEELKSLVGLVVKRIELRSYDYGTKKWSKKKGNVTIVFSDGTAIQGTDGEYGTNTIQIISKKGKNLER